jgi:hypothetical protein
MKTDKKRVALIRICLAVGDNVETYLNMSPKQIKSHYKFHVIDIEKLNQEILNINLGIGDTE